MNEPWFSEQYAWVFGAFVGILGGIVGTMVGVLAPRGKAKTIVYLLYWVALITSVVFLFSGIVALIIGQPYAIWYGLTLAGFIGTLVFSINYFTMRYAYRQPEARRMAAQHL